MPNHQRDRRPLFFRKRQKMRRKLAHHFAVERDETRDPEAVEDRKQQQWVFGWFSKRLRLFDQQTSPLRRSLCFRCGVALEMDQRG